MAHNNNNTTFSDDESDFNSNDSDFNGKTLKFLKSGGRSTSNQLLMEAVETSEEEKVPLPDYERLSQSMRSSEDPDPRVIRKPTKTEYPPPQVQVQIPFARKLIDKMFKKGEKDKDGEGDSVTSSEDGASEEEKKGKKKKKKSSWLPDPEHRWPQGF